MSIYEINRKLHGRLGIKILSSHAERISHSFPLLTRERYFQHSKIKFGSPRGHVISWFCKLLLIGSWLMHLLEGFSEGYKKKYLYQGSLGLITSLKKRFKTSYVQCSSANQNTFEHTHFCKTSKHRKKIKFISIQAREGFISRWGWGQLISRSLQYSSLSKMHWYIFINRWLYKECRKTPSMLNDL